MLKKFLFLFSVLFAVPSYAQNGCQPGSFNNQPEAPFTKESLTISTAAKTLTASVYAPSGQTRASMALITIADQPVRVWFTGVAPTATVGHYFPANTQILICGPTLGLIQLIRDTTASADAIISVTYMRPPDQ